MFSLEQRQPPQCAGIKRTLPCWRNADGGSLTRATTLETRLIFAPRKRPSFGWIGLVDDDVSTVEGRGVGALGPRTVLDQVAVNIPERVLVGNAQNDGVCAFWQVSWAALARGMNNLGSEETERQIRSDDHVVRERSGLAKVRGPFVGSNAVVGSSCS